MEWKNASVWNKKPLGALQKSCDSSKWNMIWKAWIHMLGAVLSRWFIIKSLGLKHSCILRWYSIFISDQLSCYKNICSVTIAPCTNCNCKCWHVSFTSLYTDLYMCILGLVVGHTIVILIGGFQWWLLPRRIMFVWHQHQRISFGFRIQRLCPFLLFYWF